MSPHAPDRYNQLMAARYAIDRQIAALTNSVVALERRLRYADLLELRRELDRELRALRDSVPRSA